MSHSEHDHRKNIQKGVERLERHSGTGTRGDPKKGGGGGKHTWGSPLDETEDAPPALDENDPNYDPDEHKGEDKTKQTNPPKH